MGRLRLEQADVEALSVDLEREDPILGPAGGGAVRRGGYCCCPMRQLLRLLRQKLGLDEAVARRALREAGVPQKRAVEAQQRRDAADLVLVERAEHSLARMLPVDAVHDQLRDQGVVQAGHIRARRHARVDANSWAARLPVGRDPPRRRQKAVGRILGVDPALDCVAGQPDVLLAQR